MVIVDTSVAYKWTAKNEEYADIALNILEDHIYEKEKIIVPELILYELVNAWSTKTEISLPKIKSNLKDLQDSNLQIEYITFDLINKAAILAKKYNITVYDATYVVLAKEKKCNLITADINLVNKLNLKFVKSLSKT